MKKSALTLTFSHHVTRDELLISLDQILKINGCLACGLQGHDFFFRGDPDPEVFQVQTELVKVKSLIKVEPFNDLGRFQNQMPG